VSPHLLSPLRSFAVARRQALTLALTGAGALLWTATASAQPPDWASICASPLPPRVVQVWEGPQESPEGFCGEGREVCSLYDFEPHARTLRTEEGGPQQLLLTYDHKWFRLSDWPISGGQFVWRFEKQTLSAKRRKPVIDRYDVVVRYNDECMPALAPQTFVCVREPKGERLGCWALPRGWDWTPYRPDEVVEGLALHVCPKGEVALGGSTEHLSPELVEALAPVMGARALQFPAP
jgi:hypothetical protein